MRTIKFRAWDEELGMSKPFNVWEGERMLASWVWNTIAKENIFPLLMQYTGLLDKNGKEIYEGDIVKWIGDPDTTNIFYRTPNGVYEVIWNWTGFHFRDSQNCKFVPKPGEVIGNIYENPELLN